MTGACVRWRHWGAVVVLSLGIAALSSACNGAGSASSGKTELGYASSPASTETAVDALPTVTPEAAARDTVLRLTGTLEADEKSDVASTADGILLDVRVERGSLVEKGDVLATVDPRDARNALDQGLAAVEELKAALGWDESKGAFKLEQQPAVKAAKADFELAKTDYERFTKLFQTHAISKQALDQGRTQYETAQQRYQAAQHQANQLYQSYLAAQVRVKSLRKTLDDTTILAPFSGWVAVKYVSAGERVTTNPMGTGAKIVTLVRIDPMRLVLTVPQQYTPLVHADQDVAFTVEALPDKDFTARIKFVGPALESGTRSLTVEALAPNPEKLLRPGYFVSAEVTLPGKRDCVIVPASAVVKTGEASIVYVLQDKQAVAKIVALDEIRDGRAYIKSGVTASDKLITTPSKVAKPAEAAK